MTPLRRALLTGNQMLAGRVLLGPALRPRKAVVRETARLARARCSRICRTGSCTLILVARAVLVHRRRLRHGLVALRARHRLAGVPAWAGCAPSPSTATGPRPGQRTAITESTCSGGCCSSITPARRASPVSEDALVGDPRLLARQPRQGARAQRQQLLSRLWPYRRPVAAQAEFSAPTSQGEPVMTRLLLAALSALVLSNAFAQDFRTKWVRIVVPYPAGGIADKIAREVAQDLGKRWNQSVIVEKPHRRGRQRRHGLRRQAARGRLRAGAGAGEQPHRERRAVQEPHVRHPQGFRADLDADFDAGRCSSRIPAWARRP